MYLAIHVDHTFLDFVQKQLSVLLESLLDLIGSLGRYLKEEQVIVLSKLGALLVCNLASV
jgi:hypothetical protein